MTHQRSVLIHVLDGRIDTSNELDLLVDMQAVSNERVAQAPHVEAAEVLVSKEYLDKVGFIRNCVDLEMGSVYEAKDERPWPTLVKMTSVPDGDASLKYSDTCCDMLTYSRASNGCPEVSARVPGAPEHGLGKLGPGP